MFTKEVADILVWAFVSSRLDCCNSLPYELPDTTINKLQRVQNAAARVITGTRKRNQITHFFTNCIGFQCVRGSLLKYSLWRTRPYTGWSWVPARPHQDLIRPYAARGEPYTLLITTYSACHVYTSPKFGDRSFAFVGPSLWNNLPGEIRDSATLQSFKRLLKTHFFTQTSNWIVF